MTRLPRLTRRPPAWIPLESREPIVSFAVIRALLAGAALLANALFGFPYGAPAALVLGAAVVPWSLVVLWLTRRNPETGLSPLVAAGDFAVLGAIQAAEPETYGAVHFAALFLVAAHAHFQGERGGLLVALVAAAVLVPISLATDAPIEGGALHLYEALFTVAALSTGIVVGSLRTAESSGRLRARALSRRALGTEAALRRHLAEAIHDGPIQELSSAEMMLASAEQSLEREQRAEAQEALAEARALIRSNVGFLRDEIVELGPHAFEELSFEQAISDCVDTWRRRYGVAVDVEIAPEPLPSPVADGLFRIAQEAVANAGKHAHAARLSIALRRVQGGVLLEVADDGRGFGEVDPLGAAEPGHIGLASMRERAEMLGGRLAVESGDDGTRVRVNVSL